MLKQPSRYTLKHMLDVAHDYKIGAGFLLRRALAAQRIDAGPSREAPVASFVMIAVLHVEVCLKALHLAATGKELHDQDVVELGKALFPAERIALALEFDNVRGRTGSKLDMAATLEMASHAVLRLRQGYEVASSEGTLEADSLRDLSAALDARIQALTGQTAQATRPLVEFK
jgi:hypothetical protein